MSENFGNIDELKKDLQNNRILKETYIVKIMKHVEILVLTLGTNRSIQFKNALAVLASTLFSCYLDDSISKLPDYIKYPSVVGNNIKKCNDYISEFYTEMQLYDDTKKDIGKLKKLEFKLHRLTKLI